MITFAELIDRCGGPIRVAEAFGIRDSHARVMKTRNSVPVDYWPQLIRLAGEAGISGVTFEALYEMRSSTLERAAS